jgi:antimicrobial peptide system SdpB family protein
MRAWASARQPHTNVYGLARTLLALGTLGTLLLTDTFDIFRPTVGTPDYPGCSGIGRWSLFCVGGRENLAVAHWVAILVLVVVASGWRPRITGVLHWYVAGSLFVSALMVDGGDQITAVLTMLMIPVTLADPRRWHWDAAPVPDFPTLSTRTVALRLAALSCFAMMRVQMAGLYFQAAVSKMKVAEWRDGTAVYYWFTDPWFGFAEPVQSWMLPLLSNGVAVAAMTWGAMLLEVFLFAGLLADHRYRRVLLVLGIAFHAAIATVHGLLSFALPMWGGLILYLHPVHEEFAGLRAWSRHGWAAVRGRLRPALRHAAPSGLPAPRLHGVASERPRLEWWV